MYIPNFFYQDSNSTYTCGTFYECTKDLYSIVSRSNVPHVTPTEPGHDMTQQNKQKRKQMEKETQDYRASLIVSKLLPVAFRMRMVGTVEVKSYVFQASHDAMPEGILKVMTFVCGDQIAWRSFRCRLSIDVY